MVSPKVQRNECIAQSAFILDKGNPGFHRGKNKDKLGMRAHGIARRLPLQILGRGRRIGAGFEKSETRQHAGFANGALVASSLCPWEEKRTVCGPEVQIGNFG